MIKKPTETQGRVEKKAQKTSRRECTAHLPPFPTASSISKWPPKAFPKLQGRPSPNTAWRTEWYCHCMRALLPEGCPLRVPLGNVSRPWKVLPSPHHLLGAFSWPLWAPILPLHRQCTSRIFHNDSSAVPYSSQCSVTPEPSKCDYCHGRAAFSVFI